MVSSKANDIAEGTVDVVGLRMVSPAISRLKTRRRHRQAGGPVPAPFVENAPCWDGWAPSSPRVRWGRCAAGWIRAARQWRHFFWALKGVVVKSHGGTDAIGFRPAPSTWRSGVVKADINTRIVAERAPAHRSGAGMIRAPGDRLRRLPAANRADQRRTGQKKSTPPTNGSARRTGIRERHIAGPRARRPPILPWAASRAALAGCRYRCQRTRHGDRRHHHTG